MSINMEYIENNGKNSSYGLKNIDWGSDRVYQIIKCGILIILAIFIAWMSWSRYTNIKNTFISQISKEIKYEQADTIGKIQTFAEQKYITYKKEKPEGLVQIDSKNNTEKYMYVIPEDSDVLKIKSDGYKGLALDLGIVLLILLFIYCMFAHYYEKLINDYKKINGQLIDFNDVFETIIEKNDSTKDKFDKFKENYDEILNAIKGNAAKGLEGIEYIGRIWWEFCETLIIKREKEVQYPNEYCENNPVTKLRNTDQVEIYINSDVIISKQISREIFDVLPGILTGIGLLGTFTAIAVALMGFDMGHIELSIQNLLGGLSIKFISSLAGIATSILFLFIKSELFSRLEKNIFDIQIELNSIFPRRTSESYLCNIWEEMELSNERLESLKQYAENQKDIADEFITNMTAKIEQVLKNSFQADIKELLDELNDKLSKSISSNLEEPLKKLVEVMEDVKVTKEESSSKAITDVLERIFTQDSFKNASTSMAKGLTNGIDESVSKMSEQNQRAEDLTQAISGYINQLHEYESAVEEHYKDLLDNMSKSLHLQNDFVDKNYEYVNNLAEASQKISTTSSNLDSISGRISEVSDGFKEAAGNASLIVNTSGEIVSNTADLNNRLEQVFEKFIEKTEDSVDSAFAEFAQNISNICGKIQTAIGGLEDVDFDNLGESIDKLGDILKERQG